MPLTPPFRTPRDFYGTGDAGAKRNALRFDALLLLGAIDFPFVQAASKPPLFLPSVRAIPLKRKR
jgi:hypothetical protein